MPSRRRLFLIAAVVVATLVAGAVIVQFIRRCFLPPSVLLTVDVVDGEHVSIRIETNARVNSLGRIAIFDNVTGDKLWEFVTGKHDPKDGVVTTHRLPEGANQQWPVYGSLPKLVGREIRLEVGYQYDIAFPPMAAGGQAAGVYLIGKDGVSGRRLN